MEISVARTLDVGICLDVLTNKKIFDAISEDGADFNNLKIDVISDYWLVVYKGGDVIGVVQFKQIFNKCWDAHIHILPEYRKYSKESGNKIWEWVETYLPDSLIYTTVPVISPNVRAFLESFSFKESGRLDRAWLKNGKLNDMWIMCRRAK